MVRVAKDNWDRGHMVPTAIITKFKGRVASTPPLSQTQHVGWTSDSVPPSGLSKKTSTDQTETQRHRDTETKTQSNYERPNM